jgi:endoglucanase Acf2
MLAFKCLPLGSLFPVVPGLILLTTIGDTKAAESSIVAIGGGSYTLATPEGCEPLPETIFKSKELTGPTITHQWWSSLLWQQYANNMFPHPLGMAVTRKGLGISYPGAALVASNDAIMGGGVSPDGDFRIGLGGVDAFHEAVCGGYSDWFVSASFRADRASLKTTFGHGSPFVYVTFSGGDPQLDFAEAPGIWSGTDKDPVLGLTVRGNHYGLFGATDSTWRKIDGNRYVNHSNPKGYCTIALLPDNKPETLDLFRRYAHSHVIDTRIRYEVESETVTTWYDFQTEAKEGEQRGTIYALYPHQWKYTTSPLSEMTYQSVRGEMKVGSGTGFKTDVPVHGLLPVLPAEGIRDRVRMVESLRKQASKAPKAYMDTYWEGKHLGQLATLSGIAEMLGETTIRQTFVNEIKRRLENWFTASKGEVAPLFYYNAKWGALVGSKPSYGSDMPLNDHHFHYGYFIRAAAEVARIDPEWAAKWKPMVMMLIRDIASPDRKDPMFPFIRCFDKYAGHSWASGNADFADGNNQESSSESLNAWYGMMLWGEATGDETIRDTGIWLFNTERTAVEEYWFDVSDSNFPKDFPQVALGMIWGGKGAFATWFSGDIDCIHGINWLPFTPASLYMGRHREYVKRNYDRIVENREKGSDFNNGWGDLVVMFGALARPAAAAEYFDKNPNCSLEGGNTQAFMDHWIGTLDTLGTVDASTLSDHPFSTVFLKDGRKTYAAYNNGPTAIQVSFSDGMKLLAKPRTLTAKTGASDP